ncbi:MAG: hypothetical protein ACPL06_01265 [Candidatus Anstonellales archaeon]
MPKLPKLETKEDIFKFLLTLEPVGMEYRPVKKFIADDIGETILYFKKNKLQLPPEMRDTRSYISDRLKAFVEDPKGKDYEIERKLLEYGKLIVDAERLFTAGNISLCVELLDIIDKNAKNDGAEDYVHEYTEQIRKKINNYEYISIENGQTLINKNFILYDIEGELVNRGIHREQIKEIAERVYRSMEKSIEGIGSLAGSKPGRIEMINKNIYESIKKIPQELLEYYSIKIFFEPLCSNNMPFTDEEVKEYEQKFNNLKNLFEKVKGMLSETERTEGEKTIKALDSRFYRPYSFISVIEENGRIYATISGDIARAEFSEHVKKKVLEQGYDEECVNIVMGVALHGEISCPVPWENIEKLMSKIVAKIVNLADVESTRRYVLSLVETADTDLGIAERIQVIKEMEGVLNKIQNKIYSPLQEEFRNAYASYLMLIRKTMDSIEKSNLTPEQKYITTKELIRYLHNFGDGQYKSIEDRLHYLNTSFAKEMFESIGETNVIKNKAKFWSGCGVGLAGLTVFGLGVAFIPWTALLGLSVLPVGMKLIKDGLSELKEKHGEFVRGKKTETKKLEKQTV